MIARRIVLTLSLVAVLGACTSSSDSGSGGSDSGSATTTSVADTTATSSAPTSSTLDPTTTLAAPTTTPPATAAPTVAPTTPPCRNVAEVPVGLATTEPPVVDIRRGDCGPGVTQIQDYLGGKGFPVAVDGAFGLNTETAVRSFQAAVGLTVDGIVGTWTFIALISDDYDPNEA